MSVRRLAVVLVVVAVAAAGCGKGANPEATVRSAADKSLAAGSARVGLNLSLSGTVTAAVTGDGVVDLAQGRGAFSLDLGALGAMLGGGGVDTVLDRTGIYVKAPAVLKSPKPWLKFDLSGVSSRLGIDIGSLGQLQSMDPSQALSFLKDGAASMEKVGSEKVRGTATTHYRGTLDLNKAPGASDVVAAVGSSKVPTDVWLDGEGRMRKLRFAMDSSGTAGTLEFEMYDYGTPADVQVPPADQVTDLLSTILGGARPR